MIDIHQELNSTGDLITLWFVRIAGRCRNWKGELATGTPGAAPPISGDTDPHPNHESRNAQSPKHMARPGGPGKNHRRIKRMGDLQTASSNAGDVHRQI